MNTSPMPYRGDAPPVCAGWKNKGQCEIDGMFGRNFGIKPYRQDPRVHGLRREGGKAAVRGRNY